MYAGYLVTRNLGKAHETRESL